MGPGTTPGSSPHPYCKFALLIQSIEVTFMEGVACTLLVWSVALYKEFQCSHVQSVSACKQMYVCFIVCTGLSCLSPGKFSSNCAVLNYAWNKLFGSDSQCLNQHQGTQSCWIELSSCLSWVITLLVMVITENFMWGQWSSWLVLGVSHSLDSPSAPAAQAPEILPASSAP